MNENQISAERQRIDNLDSGGLSSGTVGESSILRKPKGSINADQVAWLLDIADRYIPRDGYVSVSRQREMKKYGMLYEVMEIMGVGFDSENAAHNGSPPDCRYIEPKHLTP